MNNDIKELTPMARCRDALKDFKLEIKNYFNEVSLNKTDPKREYANGEEYFKKGVASDFLLIFINKNLGLSFSFEFNYINVKKENQFIIPQIKMLNNDGRLISSSPITVKEFRDKLKKFTNEIRENPPETTGRTGALKILELFSNIFMETKLDIKKTDKMIRDKTEKAQQNLIEKRNELTVIAAEKTKKEQEINQKILNSKEHKELTELTKQRNVLNEQINSIKNKIDDFKEKQRTEQGIPILEKKEATLQKEIELIEKNLAKAQKDAGESRRVKKLR